MKDDDGMDRSLIDAARDGLRPTDEDRMRVRRAVRAAIASGAAIGTAGAATTASAAAQGAAGAWTIVKAIAIAAGVLTVAAGATWSMTQGAEDAPDAVATTERAEPREHRLDPTGARTLRVEPAVTVEPAQEEAEPTPRDPRSGEHESDREHEPERRAEHPTVERPRGSERHAARSGGSEPTHGEGTERDTEEIRGEPQGVAERWSPAALEAPEPGATLGSALASPPAPAELTSETALLREVHRALRAHDPSRALALLEQHAARFPEGVLAEERSATRVLALCDADLTEQARAEASRFLAAHPRSMHARRVRASPCATP